MSLVDYDFSNDRFLGQLPPEVVQRLLAHAVDRIFIPGDWLMREGDTADCAYVLLAGTIEILKGDVVIDRQQKEGLIGEMGIITSTPRSTSVRAGTEVRALRIAASTFLSVIDAHPQILRNICRELSEKIRTSQTVRHEQHQKLQVVQQAFEKCVSASVLDRIMQSSSPEELLAGSMAEAAILFFDIRGFSAASEVMEPKALLEALNAHLEIMVESVLAHEGVINNFIGDAVLAVFNCPIPSPISSRQALRCALDCEQRLHQLHARMGGPHHAKFSFGVGLNFGSVVAGAIGSQSRYNYTVLGDAVNLAARLEGLTRHYPVTVIMSEDLVNQMENAEQAECLRIDFITVKGRKTPLSIYSHLDWSPEQRVQYAEALSQYLAGDFEGAAQLFQAGATPLHQMMANRCEQLAGMIGAPWPGYYAWDQK